eukprot:gene9262-12477_t
MQKSNNTSSNPTSLPRSKIQIYGVSPHECGYCKQAKPTSISFGFVSTSMQATDYEKMMLIGWRRSGTYFYKPIMHKTCCPQYTIRLRVNEFVPSKAQKKLLRRVDNAINKRHTISDLSTSKTDPSSMVMISFSPSSFSEEKLALYQSYQVAVHGDNIDNITKESFSRFLVDSPLVNDGTYGSFHHEYRLDGILIAVGVVDILPSGLSSVYFFYEVQYKDLVLGKYSALKEIEFCKNHNFEYYYMGFYIHTCSKMRYKAEYQPSDLLCPTSLKWISFYECKPLLDRFRFTPFDPELVPLRESINDTVDINNDDENVKKVVSDENGNEVSKLLEELDLSVFSMRFDGVPADEISNSFDISDVSLDIGIGRSILVNQLQPRGQEVVTRWIREFFSFCHPSLKSHFVFHFN